jgi:subtilisin family serine protease
VNAMNAFAPRVPRRLLVTLHLGEMPEHLPAWRATTRHGVAPAEHVDGGIIDRLLRDYGGGFRCARVHSARAPRGTAVPGARRFDNIEQLSGVARVLRIEVQQDDSMHDLVQALRQVPTVESALPEHLSFAPLDATAFGPAATQRTVPAYDDAEAWSPREMIRLPQALGYTRGDPAVIVGLVDTGVIAQHAALPPAAMRRGFDTVDLDPAAVGGLGLVGDSRGRDEDPVDDVGHGTGCAGILRADGLDLPPGGAGLCSLLPVRVLGAAMSNDRRVGVGSIANIDAGMKRLVDLGVKVINMSFGTAESQLPPGAALPHLEVVKYALARGVILVAASGNSGLVERYFPAAHAGVIAVGSVNARSEPSRFSTRGEHVALCAPGEGIWTCGLQEDGMGLQRANGTSFAAPFVSAVCALLAARANDRAWPLDGTQARALLMGSSRAHARADTVGCGAGVLDAWAALRALEAGMDAEDESDDDAPGDAAAPPRPGRQSAGPSSPTKEMP